MFTHVPCPPPLTRTTRYGPVGCENRGDEKRPELVQKGIDDEVLFKWLPAKSKKNLRDSSWLSNIKRAGVLPKDNNFALCWEHFTSEWFERDIYKEFQAGDGKAVYNIKDDAVPTIFPFKTKTSDRLLSINREK